ncbi:MAG: TonB family protein [Candidatus Sulfotelmatobacter sp.]
MADLPLPTASGSVLFGEALSSPGDTRASDETLSTENLALLDVMREAVAVGTQSTDSILESIAEAASVLSGANGIAIALRQEGVITCRARSGDVAPELGSALQTDSGISGECLRSAAILVCSDTATDKRVDSEVCERLGVKSIVAVPLRGRMGMVGILEAFSSRASAFEKEQIEALRALGEIAEHAYERERRRLEPAAAPKPRNPLIAVTSKLGEAQTGEEISLKRGYWIIGAVAACVLLLSLVIGLSWRQTGADIAASEPSAQSKAAAPQSVPQENSKLAANREIAANPARAVPVRESDRDSANKLLHKAAQISPERISAEPISAGPLSTGKDEPKPSNAASDMSATNDAAAAAALPAASASSDEAAPRVDLTPAAPADFAGATSTAATMPTFGGAVSQGIVEASLIHKVDPAYPEDARQKRLSGAVILDTTITQDGSVREVTVVSGASLLADSAAAAVRQWRYKPATLNGKAIEAQKRITIVFKLP